MSQPYCLGQSLIRHGSALALICALGSAPAALADNGLQLRLEAQVPVMCAILDVTTQADQPTGLAIATTCNAERYRLLLHRATGQAALRAAHSSAGPVQISGASITITSTQPGYAITTIELTEPVGAGQVAVTLQPI